MVFTKQPDIETKDGPFIRQGKNATEIGFTGGCREEDLPTVKSHRKGNDISVPLSPGAGHVHGGVEGKGGAQGPDGFRKSPPETICPRPGLREVDVGDHIMVGGTEGDEVGV